MNRGKKIVIAVCGMGLFFLFVFLIILSSDVSGINRRLKLAQRSLMREDYEQAIDAFEEVIEKDPGNAEAYIGLAKTYVQLGDLEKAVSLLERRSKRGDSEEIQRLLKLYTVELAQRDTSQQAGQESEQETEIKPAENPQQSEVMESEPYQQSESVVVINKGFVSQDGELYYYDEVGSIVFGWIVLGESRYYAGSDGRLYRDGEYEINSVKYLFDVSGICVREIKDEGWKQAYIDYIEDMYQYWREQDCADECEYWLIHIDNDEIPELLCNLPIGGGYDILSYSNGTINAECGEFTYIERGNLFCVNHTSYDASCYDSDTVYSLVDGKMTLISEGLYMVDDSEHLWNGKQVTKEEYDARLSEVYDYSKAIDLGYENYYTHSQILDVIANY